MRQNNIGLYFFIAFFHNTHLLQLILGDGTPCVTRHWNKVLPPGAMVILLSGYIWITGASRPVEKKDEDI